jgi:23S rRNA pseudouridine2605 synthase
METRLVKFLAQCGVAARRKADDLIRDRRVKVNGRVAELGQKIDPDTDRVTVNDRLVRPPKEKTTLALHKPPGYVSTVSDPEGRPTVLDLLPRRPWRLFPVGRLDLLSEGLMLLTNDGDLALALTHPSNEVEKEYLVTVSGNLDEAVVTKLRAGVRTEMLGAVRPAQVERVSLRRLTVVLTEGRKREIREMCLAVGLHVERLKRVRIGGLSIGRLQPGEWRYLGPDDLRKLTKTPRSTHARPASTRRPARPSRPARKD